MHVWNRPGWEGSGAADGEAEPAIRVQILGKPIAMMLLNANATVTVCQSRTLGLPDVVGRADIVVGGVGRTEFIKGAWIRDGAVVVDAGYHPGNVGDVELSAVSGRCSAYTPVPGGVGPMTIAALIAHTVEAAEKSLGAELQGRVLVLAMGSRYRLT